MVSLKGPFSLHPDEIMDDKERHRSLSIRGVPFWTSAIHQYPINYMYRASDLQTIDKHGLSSALQIYFISLVLVRKLGFLYKNHDANEAYMGCNGRLYTSISSSLDPRQHGRVVDYTPLLSFWVSILHAPIFDERVKFAGFCHVLHMLW